MTSQALNRTRKLALLCAVLAVTATAAAGQTTVEEVVFVVDESGSMRSTSAAKHSGNSLSTSRTATTKTHSTSTIKSFTRSPKR